jgi:hypothetical protein
MLGEPHGTARPERESRQLLVNCMLQPMCMGIWLPAVQCVACMTAGRSEPHGICGTVGPDHLEILSSCCSLSVCCFYHRTSRSAPATTGGGFAVAERGMARGAHRFISSDVQDGARTAPGLNHYYYIRVKF